MSWAAQFDKDETKQRGPKAREHTNSNPVEYGETLCKKWISIKHICFYNQYQLTLEVDDAGCDTGNSFTGVVRRGKSELMVWSVI